MRRFVAVWLVGVVVVMAAGCAEKVAVPPASARPDEVVAAFLKAGSAGDLLAMRELSGDCWPKVANWIGIAWGTAEYTVPPEAPPGPEAAEADVEFGSHAEGETNSVYRVTLRRSGPGAQWRVCEVKLKGGG